jgi:hypothetical protein
VFQEAIVALDRDLIWVRLSEPTVVVMMACL